MKLLHGYFIAFTNAFTQYIFYMNKHQPISLGEANTSDGLKPHLHELFGREEDQL